MALGPTLPVLQPQYLRGFESRLREHGFDGLTRREITTVQVNVGKVCNQACHHCHVEAGPKRTEMMSAATVAHVLHLVQASPAVTTLDITGGAPELNPSFRMLVERSRRLGLEIIDRCNLTILLEPGQEDLVQFLAANRVEITASLPCYTRDNVDKQRGRGVFDKSVQALLALNAAGYGIHPDLALNLVFNPGGASLPPPQQQLEADYKQHLRDEFGIEFNRLFTIANMPINRFNDMLDRVGRREQYHNLLVERFNPDTLEHLMCRSLVSIGWDGRLYDCDFNQMLEIPLPKAVTIWDIDSFTGFGGEPIASAAHCFGCTAGAGSSCGGSLR